MEEEDKENNESIKKFNTLYNEIEKEISNLEKIANSHLDQTIISLYN